MKRAVILIGLLFSMALPLQSVSAQDSLGELQIGQAFINDINADVGVLRYDLTVSEASRITLQAFGQTAQPTITIGDGDTIVAEQANPGGLSTVTLEAVLVPGSYVVNVGAANGTTGTVGLVLSSVSPVSVETLTPGLLTSGSVNPQNTIAFYRFTALSEPTVILFTSGLATGSPEVRLINETTGSEAGRLQGELLGGSFIINTNAVDYRIEVLAAQPDDIEPFTVCWAPLSAGNCSGAPEVQAPVVDAPPPAADVACTLTPTSTNVNIRSSASTSAPVIGGLAFGSSAEVIGIAPDGSFYNILVGNLNGWVAVSVVTLQGTCNVPIVNPPPFTVPPTAVPTQPPPPPPPPATDVPLPPPPTAVPSGPCLLTLNSPVFVYTQPTEDVSFLQDQVQSGELIPVGRLADNSWWRTNYFNAWVRTNLFGNALTVSGNCSNLPVISP